MSSASESQGGPGVEKEYQAYLQRFDAAAGVTAVGGYVKHGGQLVARGSGTLRQAPSPAGPP